jgi:hypothetical protein
VRLKSVAVDTRKPPLDSSNLITASYNFNTVRRCNQERVSAFFRARRRGHEGRPADSSIPAAFLSTPSIRVDTNPKNVRKKREGREEKRARVKESTW